MSRIMTALASLAGLAACAPAPKAVVATPIRRGPDPEAVQQATGMAADQVRRCYVGPRVPRAARQIVTVLHVRYQPDGTLASLPEPIRQDNVTETTRVFSGEMANAAIGAVMRCTPVRLPPNLYERGWDEFDLTFSPRGLA